MNGCDSVSGLDLIERYANGEALDDNHLQSMRAMMYLISRYLEHQRSWADFRWRGPEHFVEHLWPQIRARFEYLNGQFGHGAIRP